MNRCQIENKTTNEHTQFHSGMGTRTKTNCAYIFQFFETLLIQSCTKQSGQSCTCYTAQPHCISAFQNISTIKNAVTYMHAHRLQGYGSMCLVKAEENSFEYKHCARFLRAFYGGCKTKTIQGLSLMMLSISRSTVQIVIVRRFNHKGLCQTHTKLLYVPDKDTQHHQ